MICGDSHLTKFTNYLDGAPILDDKGFQSFQYYGMDCLYACRIIRHREEKLTRYTTDNFAKDYLPVGEGACQDAEGDLAITRLNQYIQICPAAFSWAQRVQPLTTIGASNAGTDWSKEQYVGSYEQSLDFWATPLSFTMLHELTHYLLRCRLIYLVLCVARQLSFSDEDYRLSTVITWIGGTTDKAYKYKGSKQLVADNIDLVINNVDNLAMLALGEYHQMFE